MAHLPIEIPPPGFDELSPEEQREYVRQLAALVDGTGTGPQALDPALVEAIRNRRERHRSHPEEAVPWEEVKARLLATWG